MASSRKYVTVTCPDCERQYETREDSAERYSNRCSSCRKTASRKGRIVECARCGEEFYLTPSKIKEGRKYCSRKCFYAAGGSGGPGKQAADEMSRRRRGRGNPVYKHGKFGNRARRSSFSLAKKGETACRRCGSRRRVALHHAIPRSMSLAARDEIRNGIPLCSSCHMSWHRRGKRIIYRDYFTKDEWDYISSVPMQGFNLEVWLDERYPDRGLPFETARSEAA